MYNGSRHLLRMWNASANIKITKYEGSMKYIFINPVVAQMYSKESLDKVLLKNGYQRVEVEKDWHKIVKDKYKEALENVSVTLLDKRCPKAIEMVMPYFNKEEMHIPSIEPILIHCAMELAEREDLKDRQKIITTPCESLASHGNQIGLENTVFISWKTFARELEGSDELQVKQLEASPIPPGYFTSLESKISSISGEENLEAHFKTKEYKKDQLVEMLYCHMGCNNGDGVLMNE